jgi:hypothetical protein
MLSIEIFINYYEDKTHTVKEIYVNKQRVAQFDHKKGKIDLNILKPYIGCGAKVFNNHVYDISKNNSKYVIIKDIKEIDGVNAIFFDDK